MIIISTLEDLLKALPEGYELSPDLEKNLAIVSLAIDGYVEIRGFSYGQFKSENTAIGQAKMLDDMVKRMQSKKRA